MTDADSTLEEETEKTQKTLGRLRTPSPDSLPWPLPRLIHRILAAGCGGSDDSVTGTVTSEGRVMDRSISDLPVTLLLHKYINLLAPSPCTW